MAEEADKASPSSFLDSPLSAFGALESLGLSSSATASSYGHLSNGDNIVGGGKNDSLIYIVLAVAVVAIFYFKRGK